MNLSDPYVCVHKWAQILQHLDTFIQLSNALTGTKIGLINQVNLTILCYYSNHEFMCFLANLLLGCQRELLSKQCNLHSQCVTCTSEIGQTDLYSYSVHFLLFGW